MELKKFIGIIPARGGSKGLPRKNVRDLNGCPLISYTIKAALGSKYIEKVIVSSDDEKILDVSKEYGADTVKRPGKLATDTAQPELIIKHVLECERKNDFEYEYVVYLQPTSPLRSSVHIDGAVMKLLDSGASSLISVVEYEYRPYKCFVIKDDDSLTGLYDNETPFMNRQELPKCYLSNGAIYIIETKKFNNNMSFYQKKCTSFIMSEKESIDIDSLEDLQEVEAIILSGDDSCQ